MSKTGPPTVPPPPLTPPTKKGILVPTTGPDTDPIYAETAAAKDDLTKTMSSTMQRMVNRLPFNVREPVSSILQVAFDTSATAQQKLDAQSFELITLRGEVKKKGHQLEQLNKTCDIYRERLRILEEKLRSFQDDMESRRHITTQNQRAINRMSSTNRMLINSLAEVFPTRRSP